MSDISQIEDALLQAVIDTGQFAPGAVKSIGRADRPDSLIFPSAYAYFLQATGTQSKPRPVFSGLFDVQVVNKNLKSEADAAKDTYSLITVVRDAIQGKTLGLDIDPFRCTDIRMMGYEVTGVITYVVQFATTWALPVPAADY